MKNKNLLITGAATRVGKAIALHFAERGWNIALHYFRSSAKAKELKKIIEQHWVKVALIKADLKNPKQTEKIMFLARKKLGTIDCLINNASTFLVTMQNSQSYPYRFLSVRLFPAAFLNTIASIGHFSTRSSQSICYFIEVNCGDPTQR